jgi:NitT/TauT family transport system permease protein
MPKVLEQGIHAAAPTRQWRVSLVAQRLALVGVIVAAWWAISLGLPHFIMPGPPRVMQALASLSGSGDLWRNLAITLGRVAAGFLLATAIGLPFGILLGASRRIGDFF